MKKLKKTDLKAVQIYIETLLKYITEARAKVIEAGAQPNVIYIPDIFPRKKNELRPSAIKVDTGCRVYGMKIIADYRIPLDKFYITQGEL